MIEIDLAFLAFLAGTVVPALVALVASRGASPAVKGTLNALLSLAAGLLATAQTVDGVGVFSKQGALAAFYAWVASQAAHHGLLKPAKVTGADGAIQRAVPGGIG